MSPERQISGEQHFREQQRLLSEVDHLLAFRHGPRQYDSAVYEPVMQNLTAAVAEQATPYAVHETRHAIVTDPETQLRTCTWLGRTAVQAAMSGYEYHTHRAAHRRVDVEVAEAHSFSYQPEDTVQVFISPKMSRRDAPLEVARAEHLADDDAIRISWIDTSKAERVMQSLLVRDIPLKAWVNMLSDEHNIFGRAVAVDDPESALSVMKTFEQLLVRQEQLPRGAVSIIEAVIPYIAEPATRRSVLAQSRKYFTYDQSALKRIAEDTAARWLEFELELAESLAVGSMTAGTQAFMESLTSEWGGTERSTLEAHKNSDGSYRMSRKLAALLELANRTILIGGASISSGNDDVIKQVNPEIALRIRNNEQAIYALRAQGHYTRDLEIANSRLIAKQRLRTQGGCAGKNADVFEDTSLKPFGANTPDGLSKEEHGAEVESDHMGPLAFQCTRGHWNKRPRNKLISHCKTCNESVICDMKDEMPLPPPQKRERSYSGIATLLFGEVKRDKRVYADAT